MRPARTTWIARVSGSISVLGLLACSAGADGNGAADELDGTGAPTGSTRAAIYGGTLDTGAQENKAVVALKLGDGLCTGALIGPNVVLTARHCVSTNITDGVGCDEKGQSLNGDHLSTDLAPATIGVYVGAQPNLEGAPVARGKAIFHLPGAVLCNSDLAIVVLDRNVPNVTPLRVRTKKGMAAGEKVVSVGYGRNDTGQPIGTRLRRAGVSVRAVGSQITVNRIPIATREFEVGQSICNGDSGGPAISEATGAVVGVVSRGGDCALDYGQIYTSSSGFDTVFQQAFQSAGGALSEEGAVASSPDAGAAAPRADGGSAGATGSGSDETSNADGDGDDTATDGPGSTSKNKPSARPSLTGGAGNACAVGSTTSTTGEPAWAAFVAGALALLGVRRNRTRSRRV